MAKKRKIEFDEIEAEIEFACVHEPVEKLGKPGEKEFKVTAIFDDESLAKMKKLLNKYEVSDTVYNLKEKKVVDRIRPGKDGRLRLTFKAPEATSAGKPIEIPVVDADLSPIPSSVKVGNGSRALIEFMVLNNPNSGDNFFRLNGLQVVDLVEFKKTTNFTKKEGYKYTPADDAHINEENERAAHSYTEDDGVF